MKVNHKIILWDIIMKYVIQKAGRNEAEFLTGTEKFSNNLDKARRFDSWLGAKRFMESLKQHSHTSGKCEVISVKK